MMGSLGRLGTKRIAPYVGAELEEKLANPLIFAWSPPERGGKNPPPSLRRSATRN